MKALFISRDFTRYLDGGSIVTERNLNFIKRIGFNVDQLLIPKVPLTVLAKNFILNQGYGITPSIKKKLNRYIRDRYDFIWVDGSIYGGFIQKCKKTQSPIFCFYHNIEYDFYKSKADATKSILDNMMVKYVLRNEKKSTVLSDYRILLNQRDKQHLYDIYGEQGDFLLPTSFDNISIYDIEKNIDPTSRAYVLFVGSNFFANVEALNFLFTEIAPYVTLPIKIIGSVCDTFQNTPLPSNVELLGKADNLDPYYANASAVISPILSGSGTKTKSIEALRYGKSIIGSPEALMGIETQYYSQIGQLCNNAADYINAINNLNTQKINHNSLKIFDKCFSSESLFEKFEVFIHSKL